MNNMNHEKNGIGLQQALRPLLDDYPALYHLLLASGIKVSRREVSDDAVLSDYLSREQAERLLPALCEVKERVDSERAVCGELRPLLCQQGKVNIAGFTSFSWHEAFGAELCSFAERQNIALNACFFSKNRKKQFQTYLDRCTDIDALPDILVGKGFSSLMTAKFIDTFVRKGFFDCKLEVDVHPRWKETGLCDGANQYHAFGAEELVVLYDKTVSNTAPVPSHWTDLLRPEYKRCVTQMGKPLRDHFGFSTLFYWHQYGGDEAIRHYAQAVKHKWHFSKIIKDIGRNHPEASPFNVLQRYATLFMRSDARAEVLQLADGNPTTAFFCLVKRNSPPQVLEVARHLYSEEVAAILERAGALSACKHSERTSEAHIRWIGWDTIRNAGLPFLKEELSDIAFDEYQQ